MEIELNASHLERVPPRPAVPRSREATVGGDDAQFSGTAALQRALAALPDTRPEVVDHARRVIGTVKYPPEETIDRLSRLLAMHLKSNDGSSTQ